ncbi:MAG TPA: hypothetical protein VG755_31210 [Nannocystaceae bacterium]|nr:hypothetical protein [Nannocystaceae bacterium]
MTRPRETTLAVLVAVACAAAACGSAPIESTTIFGDESSSSTGHAATTLATTMPSTSSSTSSSESATTNDDANVDSSTSIDATATTAPVESSESGSDTGSTHCSPILHEILYDPQSPSTDDEFEWIELYNPCDSEIDLAALELRWGGDGYVNVAKLGGNLGAGGCFVMGGPITNDDNSNPSYDVVLDFEVDLENSGTAADAIALFETGNEVPLDAVIYGEMNEAMFIDETDDVGAVDVMDVARGHTIARTAAEASAAWYDEDVPTPNVCPNPGR